MENASSATPVDCIVMPFAGCSRMMAIDYSIRIATERETAAQGNTIRVRDAAT
jgi:hypothetical protein